MDSRQFYIPPFFEGAHGTPVHWNSDRMKMIWSRRTRDLFPTVPGVVVDPDIIIIFLRKRPGPDGGPASELIGHPQAADGSWFRCLWLAYTGNMYPGIAAGQPIPSPMANAWSVSVGWVW